MKTQCLYAAIAIALAATVPALAQDKTFHMTHDSIGRWLACA